MYVDEIVEEEGPDGIRRRRIKKKKKKRPVVQEGEPNDKDIMLARAYGGKPKAGGVTASSRRKPPRNARNIQTPGSVSINDPTKERLYRLANSISGYQQTPVGADGDPLKDRYEEIKRDHYSRDMGDGS